MTSGLIKQLALERRRIKEACTIVGGHRRGWPLVRQAYGCRTSRPGLASYTLTCESQVTPVGGRGPGGPTAAEPDDSDACYSGPCQDPDLLYSDSGPKLHGEGPAAKVGG